VAANEVKMDTFLERQRAKDAKNEIAYLLGKTEEHPHGQVGKNWILPPANSRRIMGWDEYQAVTPEHMYIVTSRYS
jgi:hypothetical protein